MIRLDLHVHSRASPDARGSLMELAVAAQEKGLHGFAITDHDRCNDADEIAAAAQATGQIIVSGCEVSTVEGHVLCLGVDEAPPKGRSIKETARFVKKQGGVCVPAHPLKVFSGMGPTQLESHWTAGHLVAAEGINGRERRIVQDNTVDLLRRLGIPSTGGTDAHWVRDVGTAWTEFPEGVDSVKDVLKALKAGKCHAEGNNLRRRSVWTHGLTVPVRKLRSKRKQSKEE